MRWKRRPSPADGYDRTPACGPIAVSVEEDRRLRAGGGVSPRFSTSDRGPA